jgi:hypothetical protein
MILYYIMASNSYLVDYSIDDVPDIMDVRTDKLAPVQASASRFTFRLDEAGFLDKNTLLMFKLVKKAGVAGDLRVNCFNGCLGAIKRITLRVGDFTIQDLVSAGQWATLNHLASSPIDVQQKYHSHYLGNQLFYEVADSAKQNDFGNGAVVGAILPKNSESGIQFGAAANGAGYAVNSMVIGSTAAGSFKHAIPLGMLLPALKDKTLPLFLFQNYRVNLIVEFETRTSQYINSSNTVNYGAGDSAQASDNAVSFEEVELLQDLLIYPSSVQNKYQEETQKEGGYNLDFINVNTIEKQIQAGSANAKQSVEHRLNVTGEEVHYVQMLKRFSTFGADGVDKVLLRQNSQSVSIESVQYVVNGVEAYPNPYVNPLAQYNQLSYVLGTDCQVPKPLYVSDASAEYGLATTPESGLKGKYKVLALDLRNGNLGIRGAGTAIGQYPIVVRYTRTPHNKISNAALDITGSGAQLVNIAEDDKGVMDVQYYVGTTRIANIKSMPDGSMSVVVVN